MITKIKLKNVVGLSRYAAEKNLNLVYTPIPAQFRAGTKKFNTRSIP